MVSAGWGEMSLVSKDNEFDWKMDNNDLEMTMGNQECTKSLLNSYWFGRNWFSHFLWRTQSLSPQISWSQKVN